jgi:serine/threonine-protein kinase
MTTPDDRIDALLDGALALPAAERARFLDRACASDAELRARLDRLLAFAECDDGFLDRPAPRDHDEPVPEAPSPAGGGTVGAYRLLRRVGSGGMGEVWLAERISGGFHQQVAIKLVRGGESTTRARFDAEREILSGLDHPGIARLFDGGIADDGRPYMVMEFVDGSDLLRWCDARRSGLHERLGLFVEICDAVAYAHQQLVVHRDLKPANVRVTTAGRVKLLDFGIAKLLQSDAGAEATATAHLSPAYAAPEQLTGGRVGTATDVYALGVTLHQLLTGRLPWSVDDQPLGIAVARLLRDAAVPPSRSGVPGFPIAARLLRGDLDAIVAKALRREPEARYPDARALADDIRRHLDRRPVVARSGARAYVARRFVRRHWLPLLGTAALLATVSLAAVYSALERQRTEIALRRADAVRAFVLELFEANDPDAGGGRSLSARELVEIGARRVESALDADPDTRIELLGVIGNLYVALGEYGRAGDLLAERLAQASQRYAADDPRRFAAELDAATALVRGERFDEAQRLLDDAGSRLPVQRQAALPLRADLLKARFELAFHRSDYARAIEHAEQAVALRRALAEASPVRLAAALADLGSATFAAGRIAASEAPLREALTRVAAHERDGLKTLLYVRLMLGRTLTGLGRFSEARTIVEANVTSIERSYGEAHPQLADAVYQLGSIARMDGEPEAAIASYRRALALYERIYGPTHSFVATALTSLGQALSNTGRHDEAIATLRRAHDGYRTALGPDHLHVAISRSALADVYNKAGDALAAEREARAALEIFAHSGDAQHLYAEATRLALGSALIAQHREREAEPLLRQARARLGAEFGADDYRVVDASILLARCVGRDGRAEEAGALLDEAERAIADAPGKNQRERARIARVRNEFSLASRAAPEHRQR